MHKNYGCVVDNSTKLLDFSENNDYIDENPPHNRKKDAKTCSATAQAFLFCLRENCCAGHIDAKE